MNLTIKYFASLREKAQRSMETMEVATETKLSEIYQTLSSKYDFPLKEFEIKFAVNNEYVDEGYRLRDNDVVAFIPPVAGG